MMIKSLRMRWVEHITRIREKSNAYRLLRGKPEGRTPLGRPRSGFMGNIRMDVLEMRWDGVDWIGLNQDWDQWRAFVNAAMNLLVP
jgi:hypothetical protein